MRRAQIYAGQLDNLGLDEPVPRFALLVRDPNGIVHLRPGNYLFKVFSEGFVPSIFAASISPGLLVVKGPNEEQDTFDLKSGTPISISLNMVPVDTELNGPATDSAVTRLTSFTIPYAESLPLPGWRSPDTLALLLPGIAPPPLAVGAQIPAIAPGIGTAGEFSINGLRGRDSSFLNDGSDDNDEDLGVRRQGIIASFPQPIGSLAEFDVVTTFANASYGRGVAGFLDTRSEPGATHFHGSAWEFATGEPFQAAGFFEVKNNAYPAGQLRQEVPITSDGTLAGQPVTFDAGGNTVPLPFQIENGTGAQTNPTSQSDDFFRSQGGFVLDGPLGPLGRHGTTFTVSYERRTLRQSEKENFILPTAVQRQICGPLQAACPSYVYPGGNLYPVTLRGDALWSLFPFPNNPLGPFGANTYTEELGADGNGNVYMGAVQKEIGKLGWLLLRYNGSDERSTLPEIGGALFSSVKPYVFTQNVALIFSTAYKRGITNTARASYGDTRLHFDEVRDPYLSPESPGTGLSPGTPFLLNSPLLLDTSQGTTQAPQYTVAASSDGIGLFNALVNVPGTPCAQIVTPGCSAEWADQIDLALLGQISVAGFSALGTDVYNFPQQRSNYTLQFADTLTIQRGRHEFDLGFDARRVALNSIVAANYRPAADYHGLEDYDDFRGQCPAAPCHGTAPVALSALSVVSLAPAEGFQTFAVVPPGQTSNYDLGLSALQAEFFFQDQLNIGERFHLVAGVRGQKANLPQDTGYFEEAFSQQYRQTLINSANMECAASTISSNMSALCSLGNVLNQLLPSSLQSAFDPNPYGLDGRLGFALNVYHDSRTILRGGFGTYTGQFPAIIAEESRNAFPSFLSFSGGIDTTAGRGFTSTNGCVGQYGVIFGCNAVQALADISTDITTNSILADITYPSAPRHPSSIQQNLTLEQRFSSNSVFTISYVGTEGRHLLDVFTPLGGLSRSFSNTYNGSFPCACTQFPYLIGSSGFVEQPIQYLGSTTPWIIGTKVIATTAGSSYSSLQASVTEHVSKWLQATSGLTWSHAIDNSSDYNTEGGTFALPQDSTNPSEKGSSNFDVPIRSVTHFVAVSPHRPTSSERSNAILQDWLFSGIVTLQSAQPYTVNTSIDVNEDGNATDRLNNTNCLVRGRDKRTRWLAVDPGSCLAEPGQDGLIGRNSFRGWGLYNTDFALARSFQFESNSIQIRTEVYNVFNHPSFGIPNRILESPAFGKAMISETSPRTVQFALKYSF
jgi:hypothetical protein